MKQNKSIQAWIKSSFIKGFITLAILALIAGLIKLMLNGFVWIKSLFSNEPIQFTWDSVQEIAYYLLLFIVLAFLIGFILSLFETKHQKLSKNISIQENKDSVDITIANVPLQVEAMLRETDNTLSIYAPDYRIEIAIEHESIRVHQEPINNAHFASEYDVFDYGTEDKADTRLLLSKVKIDYDEGRGVLSIYIPKGTVKEMPVSINKIGKR